MGATQLYCTMEPVFQPGLIEKRHELRLGTGPGGGDGMDFAAGTEVFRFQLGGVPGPSKPRSIISAWVDASALTSGKNLVLTTPRKTIVVAGGSQGVVLVDLTGPGDTLVINTNGGTGLVQVTLYDFNALFSGQGSGAPLASGSGGGSGSVGSVGGGSSISSGGIQEGGFKSVLS